MFVSSSKVKLNTSLILTFLANVKIGLSIRATERNENTGSKGMQISDSDNTILLFRAFLPTYTSTKNTQECISIDIC